MAVPTSIEWSALSGPSREILRRVGLRLSAGYTLDEIAAVLDRERPPLRHHELPPEVKKTWVAARMRQVRQEIAQRGAASY